MMEQGGVAEWIWRDETNPEKRNCEPAGGPQSVEHIRMVNNKQGNVGIA